MALDNQSTDLKVICLYCGLSNLPPSRERIDSWNCGHCSSGFISIPMLNNLSNRDLIQQIEKGRTDPKSKQSRVCPKCRTEMKLITVTYNLTKVSLEVCYSCRILWFDSGEIMRLLRRKNIGDLSDEQKKLLNTFGIREEVANLANSERQRLIFEDEARRSSSTATVYVILAVIFIGVTAILFSLSYLNLVVKSALFGDQVTAADFPITKKEFINYLLVAAVGIFLIGAYFQSQIKKKAQRTQEKQKEKSSRRATFR